MDIENFSLDQGTIEFWVKTNKFKWNNDERIELFEASREEEGKILIFKDKENKLRAVYQKGEDENEISTDVSSLSKEERHHVAFTWNREKNKIILYLDGEKITQDKIN